MHNDLTLRARTVFSKFGKKQAVSLYWFVAQQQTSTCSQQNNGLFDAKFSVDFNEIRLSF